MGSETGTAVETMARECWQDLIEKDDRTSPADTPEMALITFDELRDYIALVIKADNFASRVVAGALGIEPAALAALADNLPDAMVEAGARAECVAEGVNPDWCVEGSGSIKYGPDGKFVSAITNCWMTAWQQRAPRVRACLTAALRAAVKEGE